MKTQKIRNGLGIVMTMGMQKMLKVANVVEGADDHRTPLKFGNIRRTVDNPDDNCMYRNQ